MELFFFLFFGFLAVIVAALELSKSSKDRINTSSAFNAFKNNYLVVYSLMMGTLFFRSDSSLFFLIWVSFILAKFNVM